MTHHLGADGARGLILTWTGHTSAGTKEITQMIVDAHVHVFPDHIRRDRDRFCRADPSFSSIYGDPRARMATVEEVVSAMDEAGVGCSVILGFPWQDLEICRDHNHYIAESVGMWPDRVIGLGCVSPKGGEMALEEARRCIHSGLRGIGEVAVYGSDGLSVQGSFFDGLGELLEGEGLPLLLHTSESVGHSYPGKDRTDLRALYEWIRQHPNLDIILAHWGGGLLFYELMPEVREACRRVYYDTAASPFLYSAKIYCLAASIVGEHKILFGSDYPLIHPRRYIKELDSQPMDEDTRRAILGGNAQRLWGLLPGA